MAPATGERRRRILELVPCGLEAEPRIDWVTDLCREIAWTGVLAATSRRAGPFREYDGRVFVERTSIYAAAPLAVNALDLAAGALCRLVGDRPRSLRAAARRQLVARALAGRARAESIVPRLVVAHELEGLIAGAWLKREVHCRLLYEAHGLPPEVDALAALHGRRAVARVGRELIPQADGVVTASPQLARQLADEHELDQVLVAANAAPLQPGLPPVGRPSRPIRVLYQGGVLPALEWILRAWSDVGRQDAVLALRVPANSYTAELERRHHELVTAGAVEFAEPATPGELIRAATGADVGVSPLIVPSRSSSLLAAPYELSAYMQGGLAILAGRPGASASTVEHYECGLTYDIDRPDAFVEAVRSLAGDLPRLEALKRRARAAAESEYNWEVQSASYRRLLEQLAA